MKLFNCVFLVSAPLSYAFVGQINDRHFSILLKSSSSPSFEAKRANILNRGESFFELDKTDGTIEFGSTARLVTTLEKNPAAKSVISKWLSKEDRVAASIWDPNLIQSHGDKRYTLEVQSVKFVTISLAPKVTVSMWTERRNSHEEDDILFRIESISFDPNIQLLLLPGMPSTSTTITAQDLGIHIEVVGELGVSKEGTGLSGTIGFKTQGTLPKLMRVLPESILQNAVDGINKQIVNFAISNFQRGATMEYSKYRKEVIAEYELRKRQR